MDYILTRSKRKTVALYVRNGQVEVRAPLKYPKREIDRFVNTKENWIKDRLLQTSEHTNQRKLFSLDYGDTVLYRGNKYPIIAGYNNDVGFDHTCFYMPAGLSPEQIKLICVKIYRIQAKKYLTDRTALFASIMSVAPTQIKITGALTRWGSCTSKKSINFSWRLVMASDEIIDYVVVHELAHLIEMNHSKRFWAVVESILPDYRNRQTGLKELQKRLACEDWESNIACNR